MKRSSLVAGVCCLALLSSNTFAAAEGLGLHLQLHFGGQSAPQRMELAMQTPRALFGPLADPLEAGLLNAPLLTSEWQQGKTRTHVLGVPLGGDPQPWQLNADGSNSGHPWLWGTIAVIGVTALVVGISGGGGKKNAPGASNPDQRCTILDPNSGDGDDLTVIGGGGTCVGGR